MDNCIVAYPTQGFDDVVATLGQNGFFGVDAQRRFTMTFDYLHSRIYLRPNSRFNLLLEFNMAGLVLRTLGNGYGEVADVLSNSPGSLVGIKRGDLTVAVDGRNTYSLSSAEIESMFVRESQSLLIAIERDDSIIDVKLSLKRMI